MNQVTPFLTVVSVHSFYVLDALALKRDPHIPNSNCIFIALNLPFTKRALRHYSQLISISRDRKEDKHHSECQRMITTKVDMPWCTARF